MEVPFDRNKLVVLMYAPNICCTRVFPPDHPEVTKFGVVIDENEGIWSASSNTDPVRPRQIQRIGEGRYIEWGCRYGGDVIGVYDRTNLRHLNSMLHDLRSATDPRPSHLDD